MSEKLKYAGAVGVGALVSCMVLMPLKVTYLNARYSPRNIEIRDVNKDNLPDLIYKPFRTGWGITGKEEIFLQTKNSEFVSYTDAIKQEKARLDLEFREKQDSIKNVYRNK